MTGDQPAGQQVVCTKCGANNPKTSRRCYKCRAHLYRRCRYCRVKNERSAENCTACKKPLQTPAVRQLMHKLKTKRARRFYRMVRLVASATVILILVGFGLYFLMH